MADNFGFEPTDTPSGDGFGFVPDASTVAPAPSYMGNLGNIVKRSADDAGEQVSKPFQMDSSSSGPVGEVVQRIGDIGGRAVNILSDTASAVMAPVEAGFTTGMQQLMPEIAKKYAGRDLTPEEMERVNKVAEDTGQLLMQAVMAPTAATKGKPITDTTKAISNLEGASQKAPGLLGDTSSGTNMNWLDDFLRSEADKGFPMPKKAVAPIDSAKVHQSISDMYGKALDQSRQNYAVVKDMGKDIEHPVKGLKDHLDSVIKEIGEDPLHEGRSALSDLKRIRDKIASEQNYAGLVDQHGNAIAKQLPDIATADDLLDIKQFLNESFNPKRFAERKDNPYFTLQKIVKDNLSDISDMHPPFGEALNNADRFWVNKVDLPYRSNDVLHRFWKPEDYNAMRSIQRGLADTLPDATRERQYLMLKKINNPIEFESLKNSLPQGDQAKFAESLVQYIKDDAGLGIKHRATNALKAVGHTLPTPFFKPVTAAQEFRNAVEPPLTSGQADILKAIKGKPYASGGAVKHDVNHSPTEAQKMAGNYKKGHIRVHGLDISIENPKNSFRSGVDKKGKKWKSRMPYDYGYIKRTQGADGDHIDVCLGDNHDSNLVYIVDQKDPDTGSFDEHKVFIGYNTRSDVSKAYKQAFSDNKNRVMKITRMTIDEFKSWLKNANTKKPVKLRG